MCPCALLGCAYCHLLLLFDLETSFLTRLLVPVLSLPNVRAWLWSVPAGYYVPGTLASWLSSPVMHTSQWTQKPPSRLSLETKFGQVCIYIENCICWIMWYSVCTFIRNDFTVLHKRAVQFSLPPAVCIGSSSPYHGLNLLTFCLYSTKPNICEVWFAFTWWLVRLTNLSYICYHLYVFFQKCLFKFLHSTQLVYLAF